MTPSQRARYNRYYRLRKLEKALQAGRVPIPRFVPDAKLLDLYRRYNAEYATSLPLPHITADIWAKIKKRERTLLAHARARFRDQFPSDMDPRAFNALWRELKPELVKHLLRPENE